MFPKNQNCRQKSNFSPKITILDKNQDFCQGSKLLPKIIIFPKNQFFIHKYISALLVEYLKYIFGTVIGKFADIKMAINGHLFRIKFELVKFLLIWPCLQLYYGLIKLITKLFPKILFPRP